jgi:DNA polymerase III subunit alpha
VRVVDLKPVNKKAIESLIRAGAMDDLEGHRAQLVDALDAAVSFGQKAQADKAAGQASLFGGGPAAATEMEPNLPMVEPWPKSQMLREERELLGFYLSGHPLDAFAAEARAFATAHFGKIDELDIGDEPGGDSQPAFGDRGPTHRFCGIITSVQRRTTKSGKPMANATIEDFTGQGEIVCFAAQLDRVQHYLKPDEIVLVRGNVEIRGGGVKVLAQDVLPMWKVREQMVKALVIRLEPDIADEEQLERLRALCDDNRGNCKLYFDLVVSDSGETARIRSRRYVVDPSNEFMAAVQRLMGRDNIKVEGDA